MQETHFLFVDDDPDEQEMLGDAIKTVASHISISFGMNGEEALSLLDRQYENGQVTHLIILDLNMPKMNGTRTLQALKNDDRFRHIPVIIYSTSLNPLEKMRCIELGAHSYLTKPISYTEALSTVRILIDVASAAQV